MNDMRPERITCDCRSAPWAASLLASRPTVGLRPPAPCGADGRIRGERRKKRPRRSGLHRFHLPSVVHAVTGDRESPSPRVRSFFLYVHPLPSPYPSETGARRALRYGEGMIEGETERNPRE